MPAAVLGLDIGGANLKAAHSCGRARLQPFALWRAPGDLGRALQQLLRGWPAYERLAVTMTGELCDCFETRRQGVHAILDAVEQAAEGRAVQVWLTDGTFGTLSSTRAAPMPAAAANWLALATYAGRFAATGPALVVDVGSTTTDLVPLLDGAPVPRGKTDRDRLQHRELVYTGVRRTPLCALLGEAAAAELFATTLDAYILLGELPEDATDRSTADGRPATQAAAHARLARMLCADYETFSREEAQQLAREIRDRQTQLLRRALEEVARHLPAPAGTIILAGSGEFLAKRALQLTPAWKGQTCSLTTEQGPELSAAACAYAVAVLAAEQGSDGDRASAFPVGHQSRR
jgi:(4-(4-[2-(gamma-L-glutamylamino)ethyl]phenoxymethyl)furan-2-yl)methanamine synthase